MSMLALMYRTMNPYVLLRKSHEITLNSPAKFLNTTVNNKRKSESNVNPLFINLLSLYLNDMN